MSQYYKQVGPSLDGLARAAGKTGDEPKEGQVGAPHPYRPVPKGVGRVGSKGATMHEPTEGKSGPEWMAEKIKKYDPFQKHGKDADFVHKTPGGFHHGFEHAGHKYEFHTDLNSNEVEVHKNGKHVHTGNTAHIHSYLHSKHSKGAANKYAEQTNSKEMDF